VSHILRLWGERFLLYLPLLIMGTLALVTYWLVRTAPAAEPGRVPQQPRHEPDYFFEGVAVKTYDAAGRLRSEVRGTKARHYPDTPWLEIDAIEVRSTDDKDQLTTASARQGLADPDASEVQLTGDAIVVRQSQGGSAADAANSRMEYRSQFLHVFTKSERIKSHKTVEIERGGSRFSADTLDYDNVEKLLLMQGRVRATLPPGPASAQP